MSLLPIHTLLKNCNSYKTFLAREENYKENVMESDIRVVLGGRFVINVLNFARRLEKNAHITHKDIRRVMLVGPQVIAQAAVALDTMEQESINKAAEAVTALLGDCWNNPGVLVVRDLQPMLILSGRDLIGHTTGKSRTILLSGNKLFKLWEAPHAEAIKNFETWRNIKSYVHTITSICTHLNQ